MQSPRTHPEMTRGEVKEDLFPNYLMLAVETSILASMQKKSLLTQNPHLKNAKAYQQALRVNVLSSMAIEGVRKAAETALSPTPRKTAKV